MCVQIMGSGSGDIDRQNSRVSGIIPVANNV